MDMCEQKGKCGAFINARTHLGERRDEKRIEYSNARSCLRTQC